MKSLFNEYGSVLVTIIVAVALIAIVMVLKVGVGESVTGLANQFDNKAKEIADFEIPKEVDMPEVGSKITINMSEKLGEQNLLVLSTEGNVAKVICTTPFRDNDHLWYFWAKSKTQNDGLANHTTIFEDESGNQKEGGKYEGSDVDTYLNGIFLDDLYDDVRNAIVPVNITQSLYEVKSSKGSNTVYFKAESPARTSYFANRKQVNIGQRKVFILDINDMLEYAEKTGYEVTSTTYFNDIAKDLLAKFDSNNMFAVRTAIDDGGTIEMAIVSTDSEIMGSGRTKNYISSEDGSLRNLFPTFNIDLSKVEFAKVNSSPSQAR